MDALLVSSHSWRWRRAGGWLARETVQSGMSWQNRYLYAFKHHPRILVSFASCWCAVWSGPVPDRVGVPDAAGETVSRRSSGNGTEQTKTKSAHFHLHRFWSLYQLGGGGNWLRSIKDYSKSFNSFWVKELDELNRICILVLYVNVNVQIVKGNIA